MKIYFILFFILFFSGCSSNKQTKISLIVDKNTLNYNQNPILKSFVQKQIFIIGDFLNVNVKNIKLPKIVISNKNEMIAIFNDNNITSDTYLYNFYHNSIFVGEKINDNSIQNPFIAALLTHEIVHYIQHLKLDLSKFDCLQQLEKDAISIQYDYLHKNNYIENFNVQKLIDEKSKCIDNFNPFRYN